MRATMKIYTACEVWNLIYSLSTVSLNKKTKSFKKKKKHLKNEPSDVAHTVRVCVGDFWELYYCRCAAIYPTSSTCLVTARGIGETEKNISFPIFHTRHNFIKVLLFNNTKNSLTWNWDNLFQSSSNPICHQVHPNSSHCCQIPTFPRTSASQIPWVPQVGGGGAS